MTVISVEPKYAGLSGKGSLEGIHEYVKVFTVITNDVNDGVIAVGNDPRLPQKWSSYFWQGESDPGALCWDLSPRQDPGNQLIWEVTCQFSNDMKGGEGGPLGGYPDRDVDNPLLVPPVVSWGSWSEMRPVEYDKNGVRILNACGQPFDPPIMRRYTGHAVTVVRNEAAFPVAISQQYEDTVNSDVFYGWPPETARLEEVTASSAYDHGQFYWRVRYVIHFKWPDWRARVADAGARHFRLNPAGGPNEPFYETSDGTLILFNTEDNGVYSTHTAFLNADGTRMSQDDVLAGMVRELEFVVYQSKPYVALNL